MISYEIKYKKLSNDTYGMPINVICLSQIPYSYEHTNKLSAIAIVLSEKYTNCIIEYHLFTEKSCVMFLTNNGIKKVYVINFDDYIIMDNKLYFYEN